MKIPVGYFLNSALLLTLSSMLVFPIAFSGFAINSKISPEIGAVLGVSNDNFGGNLKVFDVPGNNAAKKVEFTVFPGQKTYYRDFVEVTNDSVRERFYRVKIVEVSGDVLPRTTERPVRKCGDAECLSPKDTPQSHGRKSVVRGLQDDVELSFRRNRHEVVLSPGESTPLSLTFHGRDLKSSKLFKASIIFTVYTKSV